MYSTGESWGWEVEGCDGLHDDVRGHLAYSGEPLLLRRL